MVFLKEYLDKLFEFKKNTANNKSMKKFVGGNELNMENLLLTENTPANGI